MKNIGYCNTNADSDWERERSVVQRSCLLRFVICSNKSIDTGFWLWVCDSPTPVGKPTVAPVYVGPLATVSVDCTADPRLFKYGLYVCASTNPVSKTLPTTNDAYFDVSFGLPES